ncbi:MAG: hypothetical protein P4M00_24690 [Azospirillaceae bacterium]|nr:hypothetical protein [Azospirillaceae bacterium]
MSDRAIVATGTWLLSMVLIGTLSVGTSLAFYAVIVIAAAIAALFLCVSSTTHTSELPGKKGAKATPLPRSFVVPPAAGEPHMSIQAHHRPADGPPSSASPSCCAPATIGSDSDYGP